MKRLVLLSPAVAILVVSLVAVSKQSTVMAQQEVCDQDQCPPQPTIDPCAPQYSLDVTEWQEEGEEYPCPTTTPEASPSASSIPTPSSTPAQKICSGERMVLLNGICVSAEPDKPAQVQFKMLPDTSR